ncbi:formate/nitrite transporter family protein [Domibacillus robiginosus]|uniref:formate/nitrite transporter family protein n=1 Tax=Domibacillus robiginosus TaxID=1071054 RepID=UPI00067B2EE7|nr:formate/nitrite transporter family protein [Domibacillus robiginosus]
MNKEAYEEINAWAVKKSAILRHNPLQYIVKAMLASFFIGFGVMLSFKLAEPFFDAGSPATVLMLGAFFGIALILILYGGAELFTGNTMYFTMSTMSGKTNWKEAVAVLGACYTGNLLGALCFALFISGAGIYNDPANSQYLMDVVSHKMHYPASQLFFKAILCNWIVCLAVWIPMQMKGDIAKIVTMLLFVMTFVVAGFEHSVANMVLFSLALAVPHPEAVSVASAVYNLIPVTLGNIVGGSVFVGMMYMYLAKPVENSMPEAAKERISAKLLHMNKSRR